MRRTLHTLLFGLAGVLPALAAPEVSALSALKMLPKAALEQIAMIEGYDGQPGPDRWYVLVYDERERAGLHEYVVAGGELVASRAVSQFADKLRPEDVIGASAVKIDSDRVAKMAQDYAKASAVPVSTWNFELKKNGDGAVPLWRVSGLDARGESLGLLVITATKGSVVSHDGFAAEPGVSPKPHPELAEAHKAAEVKKATPVPRVREVREAEPVAAATPAPEEEERRPGLFRRAGGSLQHIFTGR